MRKWNKKLNVTGWIFSVQKTIHAKHLRFMLFIINNKWAYFRKAFKKKSTLSLLFSEFMPSGFLSRLRLDERRKTTQRITIVFLQSGRRMWQTLAYLDKTFFKCMRLEELKSWQISIYPFWPGVKLLLVHLSIAAGAKEKQLVSAQPETSHISFCVMNPSPDSRLQRQVLMQVHSLVMKGMLPGLVPLCPFKDQSLCSPSTSGTLHGSRPLGHGYTVVCQEIVTGLLLKPQLVVFKFSFKKWCVHWWV